MTKRSISNTNYPYKSLLLKHEGFGIVVDLHLLSEYELFHCPLGDELFSRSLDFFVGGPDEPSAW